MRHLPADEFNSAPRRFVIKAHRGTRKKTVALAIVHRDVVAKHFSHSVRAARIKGSLLRLRRLAYLAEHLRTGRLQEFGFWLVPANRFQNSNHAEARYIRREDGLI